MLERYRVDDRAPVAPLAPQCAGAGANVLRPRAPAAPVAPVINDSGATCTALERLALDNGINWLAARSQMFDGDMETGALQLSMDTGDGVEAASVICWMRLLEARAQHDGNGMELRASSSLRPP